MAGSSTSTRRILEERRRFFTVWLARTLGMDTSDEFAPYLFRAGQYHAGDGPSRIDVPPAYVTASVGLVLAGFGDVLSNAAMENEAVARAMAAWSKFLTIQLDLMLLGYRVARDLHIGPSVIRCTSYGRLRPIVGAAATLVHVAAAASVGDVVRKIVTYYPLIRDEALDCEWEARTSRESRWEEDVPVYVPRRGWRVLLNGRDVQYERGFAMCVADGDVVALFLTRPLRRCGPLPSVPRSQHPRAQQDQREHLKRNTEAGHLPDKGQRNQCAGNGTQGRCRCARWFRKPCSFGLPEVKCSVVRI